MLKHDITIINQLGLHARAAAKLVGTAGRFASTIRIIKAGRQADGKSIMSVMMLAASCGTTISLEIDGEDESEALAALTDLINDRFGEGQ